MDNVPIDLIVGIIVAIAAAMTKKATKSKMAEQTKSLSDTAGAPANQPVLSEADRRYREVQEEIRRRIAQRNQSNPSQPATVRGNPVQDYQPSAKSTAPLKPIAKARRAPAPPPPLATPPQATPTKSGMADAPPPEAAPAYPSEAAAYAMPQNSGGYTVSVGSSPAVSTALRAILATPSAARQAFLLREIFATPLGLRPSGSGGLEDWN